MAKLVVSKVAVELTFDEVFMLRSVLKDKMNELEKKEDSESNREYNRYCSLYDELNIDRLR